MDNQRLLRIGIIGSVIAALCCFTTVLVSLLAVVGLSAAVGWLDYVLFPDGEIEPDNAARLILGDQPPN